MFIVTTRFVVSGNAIIMFPAHYRIADAIANWLLGTNGVDYSNDRMWEAQLVDLLTARCAEWLLQIRPTDHALRTHITQCTLALNSLRRHEVIGELLAARRIVQVYPAFHMIQGFSGVGHTGIDQLWADAPALPCTQILVVEAKGSTAQPSGILRYQGVMSREGAQLGGNDIIQMSASWVFIVANAAVNGDFTDAITNDRRRRDQYTEAEQFHLMLCYRLWEPTPLAVGGLAGCPCIFDPVLGINTEAGRALPSILGIFSVNGHLFTQSQHGEAVRLVASNPLARNCRARAMRLTDEQANLARHHGNAYRLPGFVIQAEMRLRHACIVRGPFAPGPVLPIAAAAGWDQGLGQTGAEPPGLQRYLSAATAAAAAARAETCLAQAQAAVNGTRQHATQAGERGTAAAANAEGDSARQDATAAREAAEAAERFLVMAARMAARAREVATYAQQRAEAGDGDEARQAAQLAIQSADSTCAVLETIRQEEAHAAAMSERALVAAVQSLTPPQDNVDMNDPEGM